MKRLLLLLTAALVFTSAQADLLLKQSTASQAVKFGPFVDDTDGKTAETALTIANTDVRLSKNGATMAAKNSGGCTHDALGYYTCTLDATDTNTVGRLQAMISVAGALPVYQEFNVVEEAVYDAYYAASAPGYVANAPVSVGSGGITEASFATTAGSFAPLGIVDQGTAQAATSTTLQLRSAATFADDQLIGATCVITGGSAGVGQARAITDYVGSTDTATVDTWTTTPTGTITYKCFGTAPSSGSGGGLDAAGVRAAVGLASANLDTQLSGIQSDTDNIQTRIPASLVSGRIDASVGAMASSTLTATAIASDAITAAKVASDVGTEIGTATWGITTRTLSAGTNIVLAKGTGITGFNDLDAAGMRGALGLSAANLDTQLAALPTAASTADAVWDESRTGHTTAGTFGYYLDSSISGVSTGGISAADIADAVWDEVLSGHVAAGTSGERLGRLPNAAAGGNGGLPTVNASNQVAGVSGNVVGSVGSVTGTVGSVTGNVGGTINGLTATAQGDARTALGLASANLDTQFGGIPAATWANVTRTLTSGINIALAKGVGVTGFNDPTVAEIQAGLATSAAVAALNNLSAEDVRNIIIEDQGGGVSLACALAVNLAYAAGDLTTAAGTSTWKDPSGTEVRITATISSNGNRLVTVTCPTL